MVTGLQLALKDFFSGGLAAKSQSKDSETIQGLTFRGVLRAKENQLQDAQTVSASSTVAALAAVQTQLVVETVVAAKVNRVLTEMQAAHAEVNAATEVETPETLHQPNQSSSTTFAVGLSQNISQIITSTETTAFVTETSTRMDPRNVTAKSENISTFAAPEANRKDDDVARVESQGSITSSASEGSLSITGVHVGGNASRVTRTGNESKKVTPSPLVRSEVHVEKSVRSDVETLPAPLTIAHEKIDDRFDKTSLIDEAPQYLTDSDALSIETKITQPVYMPVADVSAGQETRAVPADISPAQFETGGEGLVFEQKVIRKQASANSRSAEVPHMRPPASVKVSPARSTESELRKFASQTVTRTEVSTMPSAQSELKVLPGMVETNFGEPAPQHARSVLENQPHILPAQVETNQNYVFFAGEQDLKAQSDKREDISEFSQDAKGNLVIAGVSSGMNFGDETNNVSLQDDVQIEENNLASIQDPPHIPLDRLAKSSKKKVLEPDEAERQNHTVKLFTDAPQHESEIIELPVAAEMHLVKTTGIAFGTSGKQSTRAAASPAIVSTQASAKVLPDQITPKADGTPQAIISMTDKAQGVQAIEVSLKPDVQKAISANEAGEFEHMRAVSESKADESGKSTFPLPRAWQESGQPAGSSSVTLKAQPVQETTKFNPTEPANGQINPLEKQQGTDPGVEMAAAQTPRARENLVETVTGTGFGTEAKIRTDEVVQQIVRHVEARIHNRSTAMHLQLNPEELGVIDVKVISGPQGVSVTFSAEQPATGRLLETQLNQLHQSLTEAGIQISGLNIGQHGQPRQEGGFLNQNSQFAQPTQRDASRTEANTQETRRPVRQTGGPGEVDYLI